MLYMSTISKIHTFSKCVEMMQAGRCNAALDKQAISAHMLYSFFAFSKERLLIDL